MFSPVRLVCEQPYGSRQNNLYQHEFEQLEIYHHIFLYDALHDQSEDLVTEVIPLSTAARRTFQFFETTPNFELVAEQSLSLHAGVAFLLAMAFHPSVQQSHGSSIEQAEPDRSLCRQQPFGQACVRSHFIQVIDATKVRVLILLCGLDATPAAILLQPSHPSV